MVGRLAHPGIVQIYDYGENDELAYIVMELVNGKTLAERLAARRLYDRVRWGSSGARFWTRSATAHGQGVVHRDVKPSNVMIDRDGGIKISDFGVRAYRELRADATRRRAGHAALYGARAVSRPAVAAATDLYAVGVIAYDLLTGERPFDGKPAEILRRVLNDKPAAPSSLNPEITEEVDAVRARALAKDPAERFESAWDSSQALAAASGWPPSILARRPSSRRATRGKRACSSSTTTSAS